MMDCQFVSDSKDRNGPQLVRHLPTNSKETVYVVRVRELLEVGLCTLTQESELMSHSEIRTALNCLPKPKLSQTICGSFDKFAVMDYYIYLFANRNKRETVNQWVVFSSEQEMTPQKEFFHMCVKLLVYIQSGKVAHQEPRSLGGIIDTLKTNGTQLYEPKFQRIWKRYQDPTPALVMDDACDFENETSGARQVYATCVRYFTKSRYNKIGSDMDVDLERIKWKRSIQDSCKDNSWMIFNDHGLHRRRKSHRNPNMSRTEKKRDWKRFGD
jgi:hypothetical protein